MKMIPFDPLARVLFCREATGDPSSPPPKISFRGGGGEGRGWKELGTILKARA